MTTTDSYLAIAQRYADGIRVLFAPSGVGTGERGGQGSTSPQDLAEQAKNLSPVSKDLTQAIAAQLTNARDLKVRTQASVEVPQLYLFSFFLLPSAFPQPRSPKVAKTPQKANIYLKASGGDKGAEKLLN